MAKNVIKVLIISVFILVMTSCEFFTTSIGSKLLEKNGSYNYKDRFADVEKTSDLAQLAGDVEFTRDSEVASALINELSKRTDDLEQLSIENQEDVLNLLVTAILPVNKIAVAVQTMLENSDEETQADVIKDLVNNAKNVDPEIIKVILDSTNALKNAGAQDLIMGTLGLIVQVVSIEVTINDEIDAGQCFNNILSTLQNLNVGTLADTASQEAVAAGVISSENQDKLTTIINTILVLGGKSTLTDENGDAINRSEDVENINFGSINLAELLGISTSSNNDSSEDLEEELDEELV